MNERICCAVLAALAGDLPSPNGLRRLHRDGVGSRQPRERAAGLIISGIPRPATRSTYLVPFDLIDMRDFMKVGFLIR